MENYQMNRSGCRPYNRTCGMMNFSPAPLSQMRRQTSCSEMNWESSDCTRPYKNSGDFIPVKSSYNPSISQTPNCTCTKPVSSKTDNMYEHLKHLAPAMAYVPYQNFTSAYDLDYALSVGTIFPQLCKPFCGKRGIRRWWESSLPQDALFYSRSMRLVSLSMTCSFIWILTLRIKKH